MGAGGKRNSGTRQSALWGSGTRGGERRSSALWGRGGRLAAALLVAAFALCAPLAALADPGNGQSKAALVTATRTASPKASRQSTFVPPALLKRAQENGNQRLHVIIQATGGTGAAASAFAANGQRDGGTVSKRLSLINGVAVDLKAKWIMRLAKVPGLVVTLDAPVEATGEADERAALALRVGQREALGLDLAAGARTRRRSRSSTPGSTRPRTTSPGARIRRSTSARPRRTRRATGTDTAPSWPESPPAATTGTSARLRTRTSSRSG